MTKISIDDCQKCQSTIDENVKDKNISINNISINKREINREKFKPPTLEEINAYVKEKNLNVNGKKFYDYFTEGNWIDVKGQRVRNWKQKILTWNSYGSNKQSKKESTERPYLQDLNQFYMN